MKGWHEVQSATIAAMGVVTKLIEREYTILHVETVCFLTIQYSLKMMTDKQHILSARHCAIT